jgi:hypothetical protein
MTPLKPSWRRTSIHSEVNTPSSIGERCAGATRPRDFIAQPIEAFFRDDAACLIALVNWGTKGTDDGPRWTAIAAPTRSCNAW